MTGTLLEEDSFRPAGEVDGDVTHACGVYAIRLADGATLPEPFETLISDRRSRLIYIGKATSLKSRMLGNELRGTGHGTFFRSIGAILGYRPLAGSLASMVNKYNFKFQEHDRDAIVNWINANLEISWTILALIDVRVAETTLILQHEPLLNMAGNPRALVELDELRMLCRGIALVPTLRP